MSSVNGYACTNCADEALAKRHIDPGKSEVQMQAEARAERERRQPELGVNAPRPHAATGSRLNLYA
ncbi:MAG TPA: hypothetical protein VG963_28110 [Polyangiaceae bacterium]|nr:hypothetical protein [Polyangiaceae bacterium]